jgi:hypothetical protein
MRVLVVNNGVRYPKNIAALFPDDAVNAVPENSFDLPPLLCLYEGHQWIIEAVASPLYPVIPSARGILMFGHSTRPQIGTIFHLEKYHSESDGLLVFNAILKHFKLR